MKADKTHLQSNPIVQPGQVAPLPEAVEIKPVVAKEQAGHSNLDTTQAQPPRLERGADSSVADAGQNQQLNLRRNQRSSGVRTKKLKTEVVTSLSRPARQSFNLVHELAGQAKQILGTKPQGEPRE